MFPRAHAFMPVSGAVSSDAPPRVEVVCHTPLAWTMVCTGDIVPDARTRV